MKKSILVDMDGVLIDIYTTFFELHERETGQKLTLIIHHTRVNSWAEIEKLLISLM